MKLKAPKTFNRMRADGANRQVRNPSLAYRQKETDRVVADAYRRAAKRVTQPYITPEGVFMSADYIDNLQTDKPAGQGKGHKGENCNRSACQAPGAYWYNHSTRAYYCKTCADLINSSCQHDQYVKDLGHPLLTLDPDFADKAEERSRLK